MMPLREAAAAPRSWFASDEHVARVAVPDPRERGHAKRVDYLLPSVVIRRRQ